MTGAEPTWIRLVLACSVVCALLAALGLGLKYIKTRGLVIPGLGASPGQTRLQIVESLPLDMQRRLVIVRCDGAEHLLLLGKEKDIVVDTHLDANQLSSVAPERPLLRTFKK
jgi:flagellar biogenesis protein FliO